MKYTLSLKKNRDFRYIIKRGKFARGRYLNVYYIERKNKKSREEESANYLGICVSKKNGNSVCRNKLKRWVREAYKYEESSLKKNSNIVVLYKKNVTVDMLDYNKVNEDIKKCFEELKLYE